MLMKKISFLLLFMFLLLLGQLTCLKSFFFVSFKYLTGLSERLSFFEMSFSLDVQSLAFMVMVCLITSFVLLYGEVYMEHYNQKKFLFLLIIFFLSMIILSISGTFLIMMIGWDGLGLSSICLIKFYPNKITKGNSIMTMVFNRVGDCLLILILSIFLTDISNLFYLFYSNMGLSLLLLMLCSFTKSAQFPLSSWLPAAMSAPTPISAMVHSSTLVTAGVFVMSKLMNYMYFYHWDTTLLYFSALTFILGGMLAVSELDFKKVIAFSTMSQISVIMLFCSLNMMMFSLFHMFAHAIFKTLLFCVAGLSFIMKYSNQLSFLMTEQNFKGLISKIFIFSIYAMSGLLFSSSFFSKDSEIEILNDSSGGFNFLLVMMGSILTLIYCSKINNVLLSYPVLNNYYSNKNFSIFQFIMFSLINLSFGKFMMYSFETEYMFLISKLDLTLILALFFASVLSKYYSFKSIFIYNLVQQIANMKLYSVAYIWSFFNLPYLKFNSYNDQLFFKSFYFGINPLYLKETATILKKSIYPLMIMMFVYTY